MSEQLLTPAQKPSDPEQDPYSTGATEEMPTRELLPDNSDTFIYHEAEFTRTDPDKDIFSQLEEEARKRGNPGMEGMEWIEADGLRYRVSSHEKLNRVKQSGKKSLLPRFTNHPVKGPALERKTVYDPVTEEVDYRTIDVLNENGDIVDIITLTGYRRKWKPTDSMGGIILERTTGVPQGEYEITDNFKDYFYVGDHVNPASPQAQIKVPREILGFRWTGQEAPGITGHGRIAGPKIADWDPDARSNPKSPEEMRPKTPGVKTQELFEALAFQQQKEGLDDWVGLTWSTPFPTIDRETRNWKRRDTEQMRIIRDTVIMRGSSDPETSYPERVFEVRTTSPDGTVSNRHIYTLDELMKQFSRREARDRKVHKSRVLGHTVLQESIDEVDERGQELNLRWETPQPIPRDTAGKEENPQTKEITEAEIEEIHKIFDTDLQRVGIDLFKDEDSLGWFKDYLVSVSDSGRAVLEDSEEGQKQRSYVINFILGSRFTDFAVKVMEKPSKKRETKDADNEDGQENNKEYVGVVNQKAMYKIRKLLFAKEIKKMLGVEDEKLIQFEPGFDPGEPRVDLVELGRLIRLSLGEI